MRGTVSYPSDPMLVRLEPGRGPPVGYQRGGAQAGRGPDQLGVESGEGGMLTGRWSRGSLSDGNTGERR